MKIINKLFQSLFILNFSILLVSCGPFELLNMGIDAIEKELQKKDDFDFENEIKNDRLKELFGNWEKKDAYPKTYLSFSENEIIVEKCGIKKKSNVSYTKDYFYQSDSIDIESNDKDCNLQLFSGTYYYTVIGNSLFISKNEHRLGDKYLPL